MGEKIAALLRPLGEKGFLSWFAVGTSLFHLYANTLGTLPTITQNALHFSLFAFLGFQLNPWRKDKPHWEDWLMALSVMGAGFAILFFEEGVYARGVKLAPWDWMAAAIVILGAIELTRRMTGRVIPILIVLALTYVALWGGYAPGVFKFEGLSTETLIFRSIYGDDALFGTIAGISATYVFMFILFGAFLLKSGAGDFIIDLARSLAGRWVGGPGLVAVFASGLTGTISGSAVANTVSTGVITIPLMKRSGVRPAFAGGVEAAASTGGQLMPPIMGAGAFVMASTTQIPYGTVALMGLLPAILYFASVAFFVRLEARTHGGKGKAETLSDVEPVKEVLKRGGIVFFLPILVLIGLLIAGFTPTYAAGGGIIMTVLSTWARKENRMGPVEVFDALDLGARNMVMTAILLCAVGLIVNVIATTGLGPTFSLMINTWAGNNLLIALVLIALASLVLGMGLPVTAAYIVLGTLSAPAIYGLILQNHLMDLLVAGTLSEEVKMIVIMGAPDMADALSGAMTQAQAAALVATLPPELLALVNEQAFSPDVLLYALLSAHMIIFWLSQDSNVTPPVCLAAFSAAAVAGASPMKTGFAAWRIAKGIYIIPALMAYTPLISGDWILMLEIFAFALAGLWALTGALEGYFGGPLIWPQRVMVAAVGAALLWPASASFHAAAMIGLAVIFWILRRRAAA